MLGEIGFVLDIDTVIEDQHADRYKENPWQKKLHSYNNG
jgi:hypothetical protein